jgi:phosphatidate cytidylyltransferase
MAGPTSMTSLQPAKPFDWSNLGKRAVSAVVLAALAIVAVMAVRWGLVVAISAAAALLANEWSLMSASRSPLRVAAALTASILAVVFTGFLGHYPIAWALLPVMALVCAVVARGAAERPADAAFGAIYIGAPCLAVSWLRDSPDGAEWTLLLLAVTWAADIGAFAVGNLVGGPKLWPRISPNKTWAGFLGGLLSSVLVASVLVAFWFHIRLSVGAAALMGLVGGLATMAGDLLESILKRRFGVKDSGDLIPGHGGLLDRVDGLMFAVMAVAGARLIHLAGWSA